MGRFQLPTVTLLLALLVHSSTVRAQTLRVATYNVNCGNHQSKQILDAITTANAGVVCLQETTLSLEQILTRDLAKDYPEIHSFGHKAQIPAERFTIVSKWKLEELKIHPPQAGLFGFVSAKFDLGEHKVHSVNVHLAPFRIKRGAGFRSAMATIAKTEAQHEKEIISILKIVDAEKPTLVVGDFNSASTFRAPGSTQNNRASGLFRSNPQGPRGPSHVALADQAGAAEPADRLHLPFQALQDAAIQGGSARRVRSQSSGLGTGTDWACWCSLAHKHA
ncbi:endonuclease/exonuclease/phosphatase family protein [Adhaeretor mobilis]|uniref:Endonuclease/Exonuclease/phosphatase family protein n=1 Tax=Adhaeretor mobilis TaxID=1930276 RepID=A0A517MUU0_9BACT|nr:endonuclease/exonuclease/phosphatase family protein [Adhaeretor mobilis]QDS98648.1 Endonuclease/Exonuclease/phosphatase family protein [Adhaeretor mobilis]